MNRIAIVGDLHMGEQFPPVNRIDNYFNTCLDRINMLTENNDSVIFLGDFSINL